MTTSYNPVLLARYNKAVGLYQQACKKKKVKKPKFSHIPQDANELTLALFTIDGNKSLSSLVTVLKACAKHLSIATSDAASLEKALAQITSSLYRKGFDPFTYSVHSDNTVSIVVEGQGVVSLDRDTEKKELYLGCSDAMEEKLRPFGFKHTMEYLPPENLDQLLLTLLLKVQEETISLLL